MNGFFRVTAAIAFVLNPMWCLSSSPDASMVEVKAAFLFNFVRYATWPADRLQPGAPVMICSMGQGEVDHMLRLKFSGRKIENHAVMFRLAAEFAVLTGMAISRSQ